jgi:hypothetical protein
MKNISIKSIATFFSLLMMFISTAQYNNKSNEYENLESGNATDKIFDLTIYDGTDLSEQEINNMDIKSINNYLSNFHKSLSSKNFPKGLEEKQNEYKYLESPSAFFNKASELELYNFVNEWIGENSTVEDVRMKLRKSKEEILSFENGAEFYVTLDYSLQMMKVNHSTFDLKINSPECLGNLIKGTIAGAVIGTFIPVIGNVTGGVIGFCIATTTSACEIDGWW